MSSSCYDSEHISYLCTYPTIIRQSHIMDIDKITNAIKNDNDSLLCSTTLNISMSNSLNRDMLERLENKSVINIVHLNSNFPILSPDNSGIQLVTETKVNEPNYVHVYPNVAFLMSK